MCVSADPGDRGQLDARRWSPEEVGQVLTVGDEIATVSGLEHASYGEILLFACGVKGMVQELQGG